MPLRALLLLVLCTAFGLPAVAHPYRPRRQLLSVDLKSDQTATWLDITTDGPANFNSFKLRHPARVVIDFPETEAASGERTLPDGGLITGWKIENLGRENERVARLTIELRTDSDYTLSSQTNDVELHLVPATARPLVALEDEKTASLDPAPKPIAKRTSPPPATPSMAPHPAVRVAESTPKPIPVVPPPPAPVVHHEPEKIAVKETPKPQPIVHSAPPPPALVVHHEPEKIAVKETPKPQAIVHSAPPPPAPVVRREPEKVAVKEVPKPQPIVNIAPPPPAPIVHREPEKVAVKETPKPRPVVHIAPPPPAPVVHHEPEKVAVRDVLPSLPVVHIAPPPEPVMPAPNLAVADEPPLLPEVVVTPTAPVTPAPTARPHLVERKPRAAKPVRLGAIGFHMEQEGPEIILHTSSPVAYAMREGADNRLYLEIERAEISVANDRRPLDTSYFDTPVVRIAPREDRARHRVSIEIDLRSPAPYELAADGSTLRVRFPALPTVAVKGQSALSLVAEP